MEKAVSDIDACMVVICFPYTNPDTHFREESYILEDTIEIKAVELNKGL